MKLIPQKLDGWGYRVLKFYNANFNCFSMIHPSDRQTDRHYAKNQFLYSCSMKLYKLITNKKY